MSQFALALANGVGSSPYDKEICKSIEANRNKLGGQLFIDYLLINVAKIEHPAKLYPPKNFDHLLTLLKGLSTLDKQHPENLACIVYYIFLDYPSEFTRIHLSDESLANYYADELALSQGYRRVMTGLWHMDRLNFEQGIMNLGYPEYNNGQFDEKVLQMLARQQEKQQQEKEQQLKSTPAAPLSQQIVAYINAMNPRLSNENLLDIYINSMCAQSLFSALKASRNLSSDAQKQAFETIVKMALASNDKKDVFRLANFPLSPQESEALRSILMQIIKDEGAPHRDRAKDVLLVRSIHTSDFDTAKKLCVVAGAGGSEEQNINAQNQSVSWVDLVKGVEKI